VSSAVPVVALGEWIEPERVFLALAAAHRNVFWLDAGPAAESGWSWVGRGAVETDDTRVRAVRLDVAASASSDGAGPFRGGWVGWADYDGAAARAGAPGRREHPARWLRVDDVVAFDHAARRAWAIGPSARETAAAATGAPTPTVPVPAPPARARGRHAPERYAALIEECRERIRAGDAYQLCLTTRFDIVPAPDPVETYRRLRRGSASPTGAFVRAGEIAVASASPERFLGVADGVVRTSPIKGTRRRGRTPEEDRALAAELEADPKERAENVMIVDLMRNDLARICAPGTVTVERLLEVETYPAVHQLVSTVSGRVAPDTTFGDLLDAAFPAGSMTGAPKLSAMTILHDLEAAPRGVFAGCLGWVGDDGTADLTMVIRAVVVAGDRAYVGAGGGITWRSRADAEVAEVGLKAAAPLAATGAGLPPGW
jgi:para-aminobenzoate synthetase component I